VTRGTVGYLVFADFLQDGDYTLTVRGDLVYDDLGRALDGEGSRRRLRRILFPLVRRQAKMVWPRASVAVSRVCLHPRFEQR
jgi:hypothetical protein